MSNQLTRKYGLFTAICMVVGIVIGSGVFFKAQTILTKTGGDMPLGIWAWIIGGAIMLVCLLTFSFMGQKYEKVNGVVDYAEATVGTKYGYMDTMTFWYNGTDASAANAVLSGEYDCTEVIPSEYAAQAEAAHIALSKLHSDQRTWIYFNTMGTNNVVAKYPSLRKAIAAAVDFQLYMDAITDEQGNPSPCAYINKTSHANYVVHPISDGDVYVSFKDSLGKIFGKYKLVFEGYGKTSLTAYATVEVSDYADDYDERGLPQNAVSGSTERFSGWASRNICSYEEPITFTVTLKTPAEANNVKLYLTDLAYNLQDFDVIIIGAGPGGIFAAYELMQHKPELQVAVFEAGHPLEKRKCPIDGKKIKSCIGCKSCSIMSGFGGAGAFSDGKYNITNDFGGTLYENIGKKKALELFETGYLDTLTTGTFESLSLIHKYLFDEIYEFAGKIREVNIAKGNFRFAPLMYLHAALENIEKMPQSTFDEIIEKYVEMNVAHPFMEGNGRSTRIWLDLILKKRLQRCIDWSKINKKDYLQAMQSSVVDASPIHSLLSSAITDKINDRETFMKGIDYSYYYEQEE